MILNNIIHDLVHVSALTLFVGRQPVKNWVVGCWHGYGGADLQSLSLASVKSRFVLPFWYRLSRVVPGKGPLNRCVLVRSCFVRENAWCSKHHCVIVMVLWQGHTLHSELHGEIRLKSFLVGTPVIRMSLNEDVEIPSEQQHTSRQTTGQ